MAFIPNKTRKINNVIDIVLDWVIDNIGNQKIISLTVYIPGTSIGVCDVPVEYLEVIEN